MSCAKTRSSMSRPGCERPVSTKLRWRAEIPGVEREFELRYAPAFAPLARRRDPTSGWEGTSVIAGDPNAGGYVGRLPRGNRPKGEGRESNASLPSQVAAVDGKDHAGDDHRLSLHSSRHGAILGQTG